jgi:hypothetical protein
MKRERCRDRLCGAVDCPACFPAIDAADLAAAIDAADLAADGDRSAAEERDDVDPGPLAQVVAGDESNGRDEMKTEKTKGATL